MLFESETPGDHDERFARLPDQPGSPETGPSIQDEWCRLLEVDDQVAKGHGVGLDSHRHDQDGHCSAELLEDLLSFLAEFQRASCQKQSADGDDGAHAGVVDGRKWPLDDQDQAARIA